MNEEMLEAESYQAGYHAGENFGHECGYIIGVCKRLLEQYPRWDRIEVVSMLDQIDFHLGYLRENDPKYLKNHLLRKELNAALIRFEGWHTQQMRDVVASCVPTL